MHLAEYLLCARNAAWYGNYRREKKAKENLRPGGVDSFGSSVGKDQATAAQNESSEQETEVEVAQGSEHQQTVS